MLTLPALRLLHVLRLRGTLTAAAAELHLSRSAASHQLASLQRDVGVALTEKIGRKLRLTEAGARLAEHAQRVLRELEEAAATMERLQGAPEGPVRLGTVQTIAINLVPEALRRLRAEHPALRVESVSLTAEEAMVAVPSGHIDVAVVPSYDTAPLRQVVDLRAIRLFRDPVRLALPAGHRLAGSGRITISDLDGEQWIGGEPGSHFGQIVPDLCHRAGFEPDIVHHSSDYAVVAALVAAEQGIAFIPASADLTRWPGVMVVEVDASGAGRDIVALVRAGSTKRPAVQAVLKCFEGGAQPNV